MAAPFTTRIAKKFTKTVTLSNAAGSGAQGTVLIGTVTGSILIQYITARCTTDLAGATTTIELGVAGNTAALIAQATATNLTSGKFWAAASPTTGVSAANVDKAVTGNIILTVGTSNLTAGVIEFVFFWLPLSSDGKLA